MSATGRCLCGAVRFTVEAVETEHHVCHCSMCRRWAGGPAFVAAAEGVRFDGEENLRRYASSEWAERGFCAQCGSNLFFRLVARDLYLMSIGAFDDPAPFRAVGEIYVDHQPPGYAFSGNLDRLTEAETIAKFMSGV